MPLSTTSLDNMSTPLVGVVMGSSNDWEVMQHAAVLLKHFGIGYVGASHAGFAV